MKIKELTLYTSNIKDQKYFYHKVLNLIILSESVSSVSFKVGNSILHWQYKENTLPYHYAINIPSNKEKEALKWLKSRTNILTSDNKTEIQYFDFWNANAIYFYDTDDNIVEFIARKTINNSSNKEFNVNSLLEISEIGLPTNNIIQEFNTIQDNSNLKIYSGNLERFCAIGDEHGLFILLNKKLKKEWFPTKDKPDSAPFIIEFSEKNKNYVFKYENELLELIS